MRESNHIVFHADGATYEISVVFVNNPKSDYDYQYVVSLIDYGECFFDSDLNFIAEVILRKSRLLTATDAINIQNAIAEHLEGIRRVKFDYVKRQVVMA